MAGTLSNFSEPDADFDAIEQAVMETERGRNFLKEFARRNRHADTQVLLTSLSRIEKSIAMRETSSAMDEFRTDIIEMADVIARSRQEIAGLQQDSQGFGHFIEASDHLESIVLQTEATTSAILAAAESIQESAWTLRETGADAEQCATLDDLATVIYTSCSSQDVTIQRTRKIISTLNFLENRLSALAEICGVNATPELAAEAGAMALRMSQEDIDFVLVEEAAGRTETATFEEPLAPRFYVSAQEPERNVLPGPMAAAEPQKPTTSDAEALPEVDLILFNQAAQERPPVVTGAPQPFSVVAERTAEMSRPTETLPNLEPIPEELQKVRSGIALNADEAAVALDALKAMSLETRSRLFS